MAILRSSNSTKFHSCFALICTWFGTIFRTDVLIRILSMQFAGDKPSAEDGSISDTDRSRSICLLTVLSQASGTSADIQQ